MAASYPPRVLVWHDHWPVYRDRLSELGLLDGIDFAGVPRAADPPADVLASARCLLAGSVPPGMLGAMPALEWIQTVTVGVDDWISRDDLAAQVALVCARGVHRVQMPENILGALFLAAKPFERARALQRARTWDGRLTSMPLAGSTLGIVGLGAIGVELARKARALEMRVIGVNRRGTPAEHVETVYPVAAIEELLTRSDYVVLLIPATPETDGLMNAARFAAMKRGAWLMNFARGAVVDDAALIAAVRSRHLAGAVLDAFRIEPLPPEHPFWDEPDILVLPHLGGKHPARDGIVAEIFAKNLSQYLAGRPMPGFVDRAKGY